MYIEFSNQFNSCAKFVNTNLPNVEFVKSNLCVALKYSPNLLKIMICALISFLFCFVFLQIVSLTELMAGVKAPTKVVQLFQLTCFPLGHKVSTRAKNTVIFRWYCCCCIINAKFDWENVRYLFLVNYIVFGV